MLYKCTYYIFIYWTITQHEHNHCFYLKCFFLSRSWLIHVCPQSYSVTVEISAFFFFFEKKQTKKHSVTSHKLALAVSTPLWLEPREGMNSQRSLLCRSHVFRVENVLSTLVLLGSEFLKRHVFYGLLLSSLNCNNNRSSFSFTLHNHPHHLSAVCCSFWRKA